MKKFFAIFLSLVMILSLSVPAFAAETDTVTSTEENKNTATQNVTASYTPSSTEDTTALPNPLYFKAEGATLGIVYTYSSTAVAKNDNGEDSFTMTAVEGETGIFSVDTSNFSAATVKVAFAFDFATTTPIDLPTDGSNMYDYDNSEWTTYTPSSTEPDTTATITGLKVTVDGVTYESGTVTLTPNSGDVTVTVIGTNLQNHSENNKIKYNSGSSTKMGGTEWSVNNEGTEASRTFYLSQFANQIEAHEIGYCNDGSTNYTGSGVFIIYDTGSTEPATITGLKVTVDGVTYESGTVTLTPNSGIVTITVIGTNLHNATSNNKIKVTSSSSDMMGSGMGWSVNNEGTEASSTYSLSMFTNQTEVHEIGYCNDGSTNYTGSGIYVIYQSKIVSVDITWGAMSFTYDDTVAEGEIEETGWTYTDGANKITVANSGTVSVNAAVAYTPADGYSAITGKFQDVNEAEVTDADISASGSYDFYLILSGKPTAAIDAGTTIGSVTVTITETTTSE